MTGKVAIIGSSPDRGAVAANRQTPRTSAGIDAHAELLTLEDVARYLRVSQRTVRRLVERRGLPHIRFGRVLRFERGDVFRWLQARKEA